MDEESTQGFERGQYDLLEHIATGAPLATLLEQIVQLVERQQDGMLCSVLLLDSEQGVVRHGAAPSLSAEFIRSIDGSSIGPRAGSCGTAAYLRERVIVEDIATHEYWTEYRHLALPLGLRACWSSPIFSATGEVLGTFAMYYREPRGPTEQEKVWVDRATHLASIAIVRDRTEQAIRYSESLRGLVYNAVSDVLFYVELENECEFRFLSVNRAFLKSTGLSEDQVVGRLVRDVIPAPSRDRVLANYKQAIDEKRTIKWDEVTPYPAGTKYGEVSITPIFDELSRCTSLVGTVHDITEHVQAQERIRSQAALLDHAKDAILVRDIDGTIRFWNKGAERLYGWSSDEAVGRQTAELLYEHAAPFQRAQRQVLEAGEWSGELDQITKSGAKVVVDGSWTLLRDEQDRAKSVLAINTDVTEKKRLELQVFHAQRMESLGTLAGGIAHDFNNVLAAVVANAMLGREALEADHSARQFLVEIEKASARATDLVRQILTFSRHQEPKRQRVQLESVALEALKLLRATLPGSIEIQTKFDPDCPQIFADPTQMHQIVMNLGINAAHAMAERGGTLTVSVERALLPARLVAGPTEVRAGEYTLIVISDTGSGMDDVTLERIFDPFFTTKEPGKGTGLGLAVVHGIVKGLEGTIVVRSAPGKGTAFNLYLPAASNDAGDDRHARPQPQRDEGDRILCIDDEEAIVRAIKRQLERFGYRATGTASAEQALEWFASDPKAFDAVVMDLSMPGFSGTDLARTFLRMRPGLPIVMTSGRITPEDAQCLRALGVQEMILKPSTIGELTAALTRALHGRPAQPRPG